MSINLTDEKLPCPCCHGSGTVLNKDYVAPRMKAYRQNKNVSLRATAVQMGVSQGYLSDLENAGRGWTEERVKQFKAAVDELASTDDK